jgi:hypothetical protein
MVAKALPTMLIFIFNKRLLTPCKQYCLAAGATQGNIAYTPTFMQHYKTTE